MKERKKVPWTFLLSRFGFEVAVVVVVIVVMIF